MVENRTGAGGSGIGVAAVAKAIPTDTPLRQFVGPRHRSRHLSQSPIRHARSHRGGFARAVSAGDDHVARQGTQDRAGSAVKAAMAKPDSINFTSAGIGTATHLAAERFIASAGIKAVHIPHRGGAEALNDVIAGRVDFYFCPIGTAVPQISAGRVLALAVSSPNRAAALPAVPSTLERTRRPRTYSRSPRNQPPASTALRAAPRRGSGCSPPTPAHGRR